MTDRLFEVHSWFDRGHPSNHRRAEHGHAVRGFRSGALTVDWIHDRESLLGH